MTQERSKTSENFSTERTLLTVRPAPVSIAVGPLMFWTVLATACFFGALTHGRWDPTGAAWPLLAAGLITFGVVRLIWEVAVWSTTTYTLTDRRIKARFGVLSRIEVEIPHEKIQNVTLLKRLRDRVVGVGSIGIDSAGSGGVEIWWLMIADADAVASQVRAARNNLHAAIKPRRPIIVGLTGSIGGGKSTAAQIFRELGCLVIDSDAEAKAALDLPEVRSSLQAWWGDRVLDPSGRIDRKAVAEIVFQNPEERARLERLVHPIVRKSRGEMIDRAAREGASMVVVDVPLLYEAGVDSECDVVVFIDAPREARLTRIAARGWNQGELERREAAQWPVADKKARADERIENAGSIDDLRRAVTETAERIRSRPARKDAPAA